MEMRISEFKHIRVKRCEICKVLPRLIIDKNDEGRLECNCTTTKLKKDDFVIYPPVGEEE